MMADNPAAGVNVPPKRRAAPGCYLACPTDRVLEAARSQAAQAGAPAPP